ncbi:hypothetical protein [Flavobacterium sp. WV_118_3]|uniref:hypothetical protein n=1 Tax=Flavobacterium sp. WV_118_3 TaxID=3151764 RepID=UPI00321BF9C1
MGLFEKSKKQPSAELDMTNPIIKEMVEWIEHPLEFNKKPDSAIILDQRELFWPTHNYELCSLVKFSVDGTEYIGFTGPITWCFFSIDFTKLSVEQLYERYTGWYIAFSVSNSDSYDKSLEGTNGAIVIEQLRSTGLEEIITVEKIYIGGFNYYEFSAIDNGQKVRVVGTEDNMQKYPMDYILPYFERIGIDWNPLDL